MPVVFVNTIQTVSGYLKMILIQKHRNGSMLYSGIHCPAKNLFDLHRRSRGGNIPILRSPSQNHIPDAAPHKICLKAMRIQGVYHIIYFIGNLDLHGYLLQMFFTKSSTTLFKWWFYITTYHEFTVSIILPLIYAEGNPYDRIYFLQISIRLLFTP